MIVRITAIGDVAQLAAQDLCKVEVEGSSPFVSTGPTTAATRRLPRMGPFSNDQQDLRARVSRLEEEVAELFKLVRGLQATGEPEVLPGFQQPQWSTDDFSDDPEWVIEVRHLAHSGQQIDAIRRVIQYTGWTLVEAKDYVDGL